MIGSTGWSAGTSCERAKHAIHAIDEAIGAATKVDPTLATLFGSQDYCATDDCASCPDDQPWVRPRCRPPPKSLLVIEVSFGPGRYGPPITVTPSQVSLRYSSGGGCGREKAKVSDTLDGAIADPHHRPATTNRRPSIGGQRFKRRQRRKTPDAGDSQWTPLPTKLNPGKSNDPVSVRNCSSAPSALARIVPPTSAGCPASNGPTGPASDGTTAHHSSNDLAFIGVATSRTLTQPNPAAPSNSSSLPFSDNENGTGMPGGGTGIPRVSVIASKSMASHGLRSRRADGHPRERRTTAVLTSLGNAR